MEAPIKEPEVSGSKKLKTAQKIYRTLWRWHFYAGVFAIPFVIVLSITGALYLFKPQFDAIHDAPYRNLTILSEPATPEQLLAAASKALPEATFFAYELPRAPSDAVNILLNQGSQKFRVYVHPQTLQVLAVENEDKRFLRIVHDIHGELLIGKLGSLLVELAACWAIVLVLTGVYLWWPRNAKGIAGILYPRIGLKGRLFWRDLHSVIGIWISFFVLFLLLSGLPWALVWGSTLKEVRALTHTNTQSQDWVIAGRNDRPIDRANEHAEHQHSSEVFITENANHSRAISLNQIVASAQQLHFEYPVLVSPPTKKSPDWSVKSNAQNRPLRADAYFSATTGELKGQQNFAQRHLIDRVVGYGIAAHEGQLFGWFNQLLGVLTALGLILISLSGFILWRKRAPNGVLGAPPQMPESKIGWGFAGIILIAAVLLPTLGASLILIFIIEKIILARFQSARIWLGLD